MIRAALALILIVTPSAAWADDARIVEQPYHQSKVVRIEGRAKVQATIQFGEDEHIENVAIGDSSAWQVTPNKRANFLFIKPLTASTTTNMTVMTDRHTYLFDLVARADASPVYLLRFVYADNPRVRLAEPASQQASLTTPSPARNPYAILDPARLRFGWRAKGDRKLLPARIYDDGLATFLTWPRGQPLPAILVRDDQGVEGPVNFAARGDVIVVDGVPREIVLRSGKDNATLVNGGPVAPVAGVRQPALARSEAKLGDNQLSGENR
jgi:type IV secretion system protein VirB9